MAYLRCHQCGAKALSVASQCPRCTHPFDVHDARGMRVKLTFCRGCRFMHRHDAVCPTCGDRAPRAIWSAIPWQRVAAVVCMVTVAGATWRFGPMLRDVGERVAPRVSRMASSVTSAARTPLRGVVSSDVASSDVASNIGPATDSTAAPIDGSTPAQLARAEALTASQTYASTMPVESPTAPVLVMTSDTVRWVPAVARTWVNVRSDASRGGTVVGVIKPSARAMLGADRAGWRLVKSPEVSGWVDPRLFEADSVRSRGE